MAYRRKEKTVFFILKRLCLGVLTCLSFSVKAQVFYSVKPDYLKSKSEQNNVLSQFRNNYPDTSITELSNYFPRNFLGNIGLASPDYLWFYGTEDLGFRLVRSPLTIDKFTESDVHYYRSLGPYASLNGIAGSKQFQIFKMLFTHTYKKVNITVGFNRYTSTGFYKRQQTFTNNFYLSSNYTNKKNSAGYYLYILNNSNKSQENGGIADSVLTDSSMIYDKSLFKVNLNGASRDNRETKFMINPWLRINKHDSATKLDHFVQLKSKFSANSYRYIDTFYVGQDRFYQAGYQDTINTHDSVNVKKFMNELSYSLLSTDQKLGFSVGYRNEVNRVWQFTDSVFMNHILQSDFVFRTPLISKDSLDKTKRYFESRLNAQYILAGPNQSNSKGEANFVYTFNDQKKRYVFFNLLFERRSADYIYNNWTSNHFWWFNNGYKPQTQAQAKLGIRFGRIFSASLFLQSINNYLYFDQNALPQQFSKKTIANFGANITATKVFFKHLGLSLNYTYQQTSHEAYVRVPPQVTTAKLFYSGNLAKNNLQLQIGTQLQIYQSFYALAYMPATQVFYLQDRFKTEPYPYLDIFLNARIRPVSFFLKVENVLKGYAGPGYSLVPGYYQTDLAFRFGLTWMFFD